MIKLFPHQIKALEETSDCNRVAYYLDMGLGKTFVGSEKMIQLGCRINLLVCQNTKIDDWKEHFEKYYSHIVFVLRNQKEQKMFLAANKSQGYKCIGIVNYELAWRRKELLDLKDFTLMLDESSLIQSSKAKQTKFIMKLNPKNVILLSGTPTSGKYENLWTQMSLLGYNISEDLYLKQYVNFKTVRFGGMIRKTIDKDNPYKNVERLKSKLRQHGCVFMKTEECFDLPEQNFIAVHVPKSKDYVKFITDDYVQLADGTELIGDTSLTKRLRARQLCGQYSEAKLQAFVDLLESTQDRLIVFYNFNDEMYQLEQICKDLGRTVGVINGERKDKELFDKHSDCVLLCQYQAASMGLNLQAANKIIYYTVPERSELFEQSKKRIHRIGQQNKCFYYVMMCKGSIEEKIYDRLQQLRDYTDDLFKEDFGDE